MVFCPACGHENPDKNDFCGKCGTELPKLSQTKKPLEGKQKKEKKEARGLIESRGKTLTIGSVLAFLASFFTFGVGYTLSITLAQGQGMGVSLGSYIVVISSFTFISGLFSYRRMNYFVVVPLLFFSLVFQLLITFLFWMSAYKTVFMIPIIIEAVLIAASLVTVVESTEEFR